MERRSFLAGIGLAAGALAVLAPTSRAGAASQPIRLFDARIANRDHFAATRLPEVGAQLSLRRIADRSFDAASIRVDDDAGRGLGYLPPICSGALAALIDHGASAFAVAETATLDGSMRVTVYLGAPAVGNAVVQVAA